MTSHSLLSLIAIQSPLTLFLPLSISQVSLSSLHFHNCYHVGWGHIYFLSYLYSCCKLWTSLTGLSPAISKSVLHILARETWPKHNYDLLPYLQNIHWLGLQIFCHLACDWRYSFLSIFPFVPFTPVFIQGHFHFTELVLILNFLCQPFGKPFPISFPFFLLCIKYYFRSFLPFTQCWNYIFVCWFL